MLSTDPDPFEDPGLSNGGCARNALLHDLSLWRDQLARSIARNNHGLQSDTIASCSKPDYWTFPVPLYC